MLNKPEGYICSVSDQFDRPTVTDIVKEEIPNVSLYPVGRLDYDTSGLLILTNDGDFTYKVTHPKNLYCCFKGRYNYQPSRSFAQGNKG